MAPEIALAVTDLCVSYGQSQRVLDHLNVEIPQGSKVGVIGANGAGKTTFFLTLCGVIPPEQGEIRLFGQPQTGINPQIGLVFQNPDDQLFCTSVYEDIAFGPINLKLDSDEINHRVEQAMELTGITALSARPPHHLSGGEKRMVAIATILAMQPRLTLYDEPSANLDLKARRRLIQFLQATADTFLISSHDLELILEVCDRVLLFAQGKIVTQGPTRQILGDQTLMETYHLEIPYSLQA